MMENKVYIPKYFELYELLPPELYTYDMMTSEVARERAFANYFDRKLLETIDIIRGKIIKAPLICNTWFQDGNRVASGYRSSKCPVGVAKSQHKEGKAVDLVCNKYTAEQMRQMIKENEHLLPYPIRIEEGVSWLHIDTKDRTSGPRSNEKIYFFKG
ncbi:MAG: hypothetical protein IIW11_03015 [Bacteroidales bacterium]|nr:hypothetical protein [Bacteroidales bacterium]